MPEHSVTQNSKAEAPRRLNWRMLLAWMALGLAVFELATSPLILSTPGGFVDAYLRGLAFCLLAAALGSRKAVVVPALLLGYAAIFLIRADHKQGMVYMREQARRSTLENLGIAVLSQPAKPTTQAAGIATDAWYMQYLATSPQVRRYAQRMNSHYSILEAEAGRDFVILEFGENHEDHFTRAFSLKILRDGRRFIECESGQWQPDP